MSDQLMMFNLQTCKAIPDATSLPESADGILPLQWAGWPDERSVWTGSCPCQPFSSRRKAARCYRRTTSLARFSTTHRRAPTCNDLWRAGCDRNLEGNGCPLFALTWKHWDMPAGPPICRLRAWGHRTSASVFGGWLTASASDGTRGTSSPIGTRRTGTDLPAWSAMAPWSTPRVTTNSVFGSPARATDGKARLEDQVQGAGWTNEEWDKIYRDWMDGKGFDVDPTDTGKTSNISHAPTENCTAS